MSLSLNAKKTPDKPATIIAETGEWSSYAELDQASMRFSQVLAAAGLQPGAVVAVMMENDLHYHEVVWGTLRSGMYLVTVSRYYTTLEAEYILADSDADALVVSHTLADAAAGLGGNRRPRLRLMTGRTIAGFESYEEALAGQRPEPVRSPEPSGDWMLYSSGTTGNPLGIRRPLADRSFEDPLLIGDTARNIYGLDEDSVFLAPAPLHHSAPLCYTAATHSLGGTNVLMTRFDAEQALAAIERHRVTVGQWVPSMFVRMLKLPDSRRAAADLSSQQVAVHGAAPCPPEIKQRMIEWWGPILIEIYGSTEFAGLTACTSEEWMQRPGSLGRAKLGVLHICDRAGNELPAGEPGIVYFERDTMPFQYHNSPERTAQTQHPEHPGWTQVGDIGHLDDAGYLYLHDRDSFTIICGGVNVYPQEVENVLLEHPDVFDAAVFGIPSEELGEEVKAVVQLTDQAREQLPPSELTLRGFARERLAGIKVPRSIDFVETLPRQETGKLYKRFLQTAYSPRA